MIIVQNLVAVSHAVGARRRSQNWGMLGPTTWDVGIADPLDTCYSTTRVTIPNFVAVGETVSAYVWGRYRLTPLRWGHGGPHINGSLTSRGCRWYLDYNILGEANTRCGPARVWASMCDESAAVAELSRWRNLWKRSRNCMPAVEFLNSKTMLTKILLTYTTKLNVAVKLTPPIMPKLEHWPITRTHLDSRRFPVCGCTLITADLEPATLQKDSITVRILALAYHIRQSGYSWTGCRKCNLVAVLPCDAWVHGILILILYLKTRNRRQSINQSIFV